MSLETDQAAARTAGAPGITGSGLRAHLPALADRFSPDTWAMLAVATFVVLAHLPYLLGLFDANPLGPQSGLVSSIVPGPLGGQPTIDPNNGFISQALGHLATRDLLHLHLPWWNPYEGTGMPLAGQLQSAAFFPPTWLTLLSNGQLYEHILLELVAGLSTYLLLRRISVNRWAGTAAAIAFALNGTFAWFTHATVNPVAFLPLLLLGIELAYSAAATDAPGGWWLIAVAGALSFYAGFPEVTYIDTLMAICWFAWRAGCLRRGRLRAFAGKGAAGATAAALVSAPLLIAMTDYFTHAALGLHASSLLGSGHFGTQGLPQLLLPYIYGPIFDYTDPGGLLLGQWESVGGYLTASLMLFALLGLFSSGRRGLRLTLFAWALLVFARMYGQPSVLSGALGVLPDMSRVAFFRYGTASLELSVIILAALGIDDLAKAPERRRRLAWSAFAMVVALALAVVEARTLTRLLPAKFAHRPYFAVAIGWAALTVVGAVGAAFLLRPRLRVALFALLLATDAAAMFAVPELSAPRTLQLDPAPVAFLQRHLGTSRFFTLGPLAPNYGSYYDLASLNVNDFPPKSFTAYVHARLDQVVDPTVFVGNYGGGRPFLAPSPEQELLRNLSGYREAGVAYVLTPAGQALSQSPSTFTLVFKSPSTWIYRLAGSAGYFTATNARCTVTFQSEESAGLNCPRPTMLVRRETAFAGWSATIDGRSARISSADGLFQAVTVGAGSHRVQFDYQPPNIGWAYVAFAAGCAWLLLPAIRAYRSPSARGAS